MNAFSYIFRRQCHLKRNVSWVIKKAPHHTYKHCHDFTSTSNTRHECFSEAASKMRVITCRHTRAKSLFTTRSLKSLAEIYGKKEYLRRDCFRRNAQSEAEHVSTVDLGMMVLERRISWQLWAKAKPKIPSSVMSICEGD